MLRVTQGLVSAPTIAAGAALAGTPYMGAVTNNGMLVPGAPFSPLDPLTINGDLSSAPDPASSPLLPISSLRERQSQ
jgi:hypothetical protein